MKSEYPKVAQLKSVGQLRERLAELGLSIPIDETILTAQQGSPLARPLTIGNFTVGNRWCIHDIPHAFVPSSVRQASLEIAQLVQP